MHPEIDLSPESICGTVIDTQETIIQGQQPNEHQIRACKLANASESLLAALSELVQSLKPQDLSGGAYKASVKAFDLLKALPKVRAK